MTDEEANEISGCGHGCYVIGGRWIAENPSCPVHGIEAREREDDREEEIDRLRAKVSALELTIKNHCSPEVRKNLDDWLAKEGL
jgi:hypothetical protein